MAPLCAALAGVYCLMIILALVWDESGNLIVPDLEKKNFQKTGELIDNHSVKCSHRLPTNEPKEINTPAHEWVEKYSSMAPANL